MSNTKLIPECYIKTNKRQPPVCRICFKDISHGDGILTFRRPASQWYPSTKSRIHGKCLVEYGNKAVDTEKDIKTFELVAAKKKASRVKDYSKLTIKASALRAAADFRKQIIKKALKTQHINMSSLYITRKGSAGLFKGKGFNQHLIGNKVFGVSAFPKKQGPLVMVTFHESLVIVDKVYYGAMRHSYSPSGKKATISLADPHSLESIGEAIMAFDAGSLQDLQKTPTTKTCPTCKKPSGPENV